MADFSLVAISEDAIENSPSRADGIDEKLETSQRTYGCSLIQRAGVYLRLKAVTIASAQIILHRFYFRRSLKDFDVRFVASASLYLACKLQEDARRVKDVILVFTFIQWKEAQKLNSSAEPPEVLQPESKDFLIIKNTIHRVERHILKETGFLISQTLTHPHGHILKFVDRFFANVNLCNPNEIAQRAWGYINDSYRSTLCCHVDSKVVAAAAIYMAAWDINVPLAKELKWYEVFDVSWDVVMSVVSRIRDIYKGPSPSYIKLASSRRREEALVASGNSATSTSGVNSTVSAATPADNAPLAASATAADSEALATTRDTRVEQRSDRNDREKEVHTVAKSGPRKDPHSLSPSLPTSMKEAPLVEKSSHSTGRVNKHQSERSGGSSRKVVSTKKLKS